MALDPDVAALLEMLKAMPFPGPGSDLVAYRAGMAANAGRMPSPPIARVEDLTLPGVDGAIAARFYSEGSADAPLLLFFHGGGWATCSIDTHDELCRRLALRLHWNLLSIDYRLAPEHPFPAAFDDGYAALEWIAGAGAALLGVSPSRLIVGGDSAGGNIAAALAIATRDRNGPQIDHQLLLYPALDPRMATGSCRENAHGYHLTIESLAWLWGLYLGENRADPLAAPAFCADLAGLPPATIVTAAYDPLRDEGRDYADRLRAAGVPVDSLCIEGTIHGFASIPFLASTARLMDQLADTLEPITAR